MARILGHACAGPEFFVRATLSDLVLNPAPAATTMVVRELPKSSPSG